MRFLISLLIVSACSWLSHCSQLNTQRYQRIHQAGGGSFLINKVNEKPSAKVKEVISTVTKIRAPPKKIIKPSPPQPVVQSTPTNPEQAVAQQGSPPPPPAPTAFATVDVFFIFSYDQQFPYVVKQYYWVLTTVAAMFSKTNINGLEADIRIHVLSDSPDILEKASSLGFYSYDLVPHIDRNSKFLTRVSRTVNDSAGELSIFRWSVLSHIVTDWNSQTAESPISRVIALEGDTLMTVHAAALYDRAVLLCRKVVNAEITPESISIAEAMMLFSPLGLSNFAAFIDDWYNSCMRDELRKKSVGTLGRPWSDAILYEHFAAASTMTRMRVKWFDPLNANSTFVHTREGGKSAPPQEVQLDAALGCEPLASYWNPYGVHFEVNGRILQLRNQPVLPNALPQDPRVHGIHVYGPDKKYPYCFMRFEVKDQKNMMYAYGRALEILRGGEEARSPNALDNLSGDLVVSPEKSREVYFLSSNGTRYFVASQEEFVQKMFLSREQVISRVPMEVIEAFTPLPMDLPWRDKDLISLGNSRTIYYVDRGKLRPLANPLVLERLGKTVKDVVTYRDYAGPVSNSLPYGLEMI